MQVELIRKRLLKGQKLKVDTGCFVAITKTIDYDIEFVGGIKSSLFGEEGLFFATLTGPGEVWCKAYHSVD